MLAFTSSPLVTRSCPILTAGCLSFGGGNFVIVTTYTPGRRLRIVYAPPASVVDSNFAPCSLTASTVRLNNGFPSIPIIVPPIDPPPCALAPGARTPIIAAAISTAFAQDFSSFLILLSPLPNRTPIRPGGRDGRIILTILANFQVGQTF